MVFARPCGSMLCGLSIMGVPGGTAQDVMDDPGSPGWIAAVALPDDRTVVAAQGIYFGNNIRLASRQEPTGGWVTAALDFKDVTVDGPRWAVAAGRPWLVGAMEDQGHQFYAVTLEAGGQVSVVRSGVFEDCVGIPPMVSAVAVEGVVHVVEVCNQGDTSNVNHAVLQDAATSGASFSSPGVLPFEPPMPGYVAGGSVVARGSALAVVFAQGSTLRAAWPDAAGTWRHQKVSHVGDGELDVGYFRGSQSGNNMVVAWTPGHEVYSVVGSETCGDSELFLFQSWLALTQLSL